MLVYLRGRTCRLYYSVKWIMQIALKLYFNESKLLFFCNQKKQKFRDAKKPRRKIRPIILGWLWNDPKGIALAPDELGSGGPRQSRMYSLIYSAILDAPDPMP